MPINRRQEDARPRFEKLSDVRNYFGISANGLKLYEREGLARLSRDEENDYRYCTLADAVLLCNAVDYTHYGFTLHETAGILLEEDLEQQLASLDGLNERYRDQMEDLLAKQRRLERDRDALRTYVSDPLSCAVVHGWDLWDLPIHTQDLRMGPGNADARQWWTQAPFVTTGAIVTRGEDGGAAEMWHGPVADDRDVARLRLPLGNAVHFCMPEKPYIRAFAVYRADELPCAQTYAHIDGYLVEHGLTVADKLVLHRLVRYRDVEKTPMRIDEVLLEVQKV